MGIPVYSPLTGKDNAESHVSTIREALGLIQRHDLRQFQRVRTGFDYIMVFGSGSTRGSYNPALRMCRINDDASEPAVAVAMTLVHEATHAHIISHGIQYGERFRKRIERLCVLAELAFARRLPTYPTELAVRSSVSLNAPNGYWSDYSIVQYHASELRAAGVPKIIVHGLAWLALQRVVRRPDVDSKRGDRTRRNAA